MKALRFHSFGGPEVIALEDTAEPRAADGEVLVRVKACGLNFADTERRRGLYLASPLPETLGFEGAGVIEGTDQRVAFVAPRAHAELCVVPRARLISIPDQMDLVTAAAFPVQWLTAWHVLHTVGRVRAGETVLIHGAAGGVGQAVVQLAKATGARVIATVSRDAKQRIVHELGADEVHTRTPELELNGVDLLLEGIGKDIAPSALKCLKPFGRWVTYGSASGHLPPLDAETLYEKSVSFSAYWLRTEHPREVWQRAVEDVLAFLPRAKLEVTTAPLSDAARWHRRLEGGLTTGKIVFTL
ncbi:MAG: zinc-binding dehydrogenase [Archangium sp.]|nr:zinc-binding dehydrogenase [Archangium sp.]